MKAVLLIIDSFGVGALPDAAEYGDSGANTALHICEGMPFVRWPVLKNLGLGNSAALLGHLLNGCEAQASPLASFGVMAEASAGKDTTTGHWELAGLVLDQPFQTFPLAYPSFPDALIDEFKARTGYEVLGNKGASGTVIIEELGYAHMDGQGIILYTSADSVLQIAAHEEIVPVEELYRVCGIAREICNPFNVGRVIARPFEGTPGKFRRTASRRDFSMPPAGKTILDHLSTHGIQTLGIGKIGDIFCEQGIDVSHHDAGNAACLDRLVSCIADDGTDRFIFINLVDTDMLFGHRRNIKGYHDAVAGIDARLTAVMDRLDHDDLLIITADHGCDHGFKGTDHTREYVPLLVFQPNGAVRDLGIRRSFSDVAQSLASFFNLPAINNGRSFF